MFRRHFMQRITCAGTALFATRNVSQAGERKTVTYKVKGFTCIACAVGLETMLKQEKGVFRADASYPKATVIVEFDPAVVSEKCLKEYIGGMGFGIEAGDAK